MKSDHPSKPPRRSTAKQPVRRPGGRSARVFAAVARAVASATENERQTEVTMAEIAELSGVHVTSLYRRWGTIDALLIDVTLEVAPYPRHPQNVGTLEGDLLAWAQRVSRSVSGSRGRILLRAALRAAPGDRAVLFDRVSELQPMLDRAAARGEPRVAYADVIDCVVAPIYARRVFGSELDFAYTSESPAYLRRLVQRALAAASAPDGPVKRPAPR